MNALQLLSKRTFKLYIILIIQVLLSLTTLIKDILVGNLGFSTIVLIDNIVSFIFVGVNIFLIVVFYKATKTSKQLVFEDSGEGYLKYSNVINHLNSFLIVVFVISVIGCVSSFIMLFAM